MNVSTNSDAAHTTGLLHVDTGMISMEDQASFLVQGEGTPAAWVAICTGEEMNDEESVVALAHPSNACRLVAAWALVDGLPTGKVEIAAKSEAVRKAIAQLILAA